MAKKLTLTTPHAQVPAVTSYTLVRMTVQYDAGTASVDLIGDGGQGFNVSLSSVPATTQEQAILALVNNGVLAGTIGNA